MFKSSVQSIVGEQIVSRRHESPNIKAFSDQTGRIQVAWLHHEISLALPPLGPKKLERWPRSPIWLLGAGFIV